MPFYTYNPCGLWVPVGKIAKYLFHGGFGSWFISLCFTVLRSSKVSYSIVNCFKKIMFPGRGKIHLGINIIPAKTQMSSSLDYCI